MIIRALLLYALVLGFTACSVYRSPDRDYFDDNGRTGAPVTKPTRKPTVTEFDTSPTEPNGDLRDIRP